MFVFRNIPNILRKNFYQQQSSLLMSISANNDSNIFRASANCFLLIQYLTVGRVMVPLPKRLFRFAKIRTIFEITII